jgi:hypothetical protein
MPGEPVDPCSIHGRRWEDRNNPSLDVNGSLLGERSRNLASAADEVIQASLIRVTNLQHGI